MMVASLGEVVVTAGYWTVKDRERTVTYPRVTADEIQKQTISNPLQGLIGRMPECPFNKTTGVLAEALTSDDKGAPTVFVQMETHSLHH